MRAPDPTPARPVDSPRVLLLSPLPEPVRRAALSLCPRTCWLRHPDVDAQGLERQARLFRPKLIIAGASAYSREWDYARMRKVGRRRRTDNTAMPSNEWGFKNVVLGARRVFHFSDPWFFETGSPGPERGCHSGQAGCDAHLRTGRGRTACLWPFCCLCCSIFYTQYMRLLYLAACRATVGPTATRRIK